MANEVEINLELITKQFQAELKKATSQAERFQNQVTGDIDAVRKSVDKLGSQSKKSGQEIASSFSTAKIAVGGFFGALAVNVFQGVISGISDATRAVINLGIESTQAASDAAETESKFQAVFSSIADGANDVAKELSQSYGLGVTESQALLSATGDLLTGFGFAQDEALNLSSEVQKLAVDLASFTNFSGGAQGASEALTKALLGERESVKALGISIQEKDVQEQVAINRAKGLTFETERQAKAQATLDIAIRQSANAIGDYAKTSDGAANQFRLFNTRIEDLRIGIGAGLLPAVAEVTRGLNRFIASIDVEQVTGFVKQGIVVLIQGLADLTQFINPVITGFRLLKNTGDLFLEGLVAGFNVLRLGFQELIDGLIGGISTLINVLPDSIVPDGWKEGIETFKSASAETLSEFRADVGASQERISKDFDDIGDSFADTIDQETIDKIKAGLLTVEQAVRDSSTKVTVDQETERAKRLAALERDQQQELALIEQFNTQKAELEFNFQEQQKLLELERKALELESEGTDRVSQLEARAAFEQAKIDVALEAELRKNALIQDARKRDLADNEAINKAIIASQRNKAKTEIDIQKAKIEAEKQQNAVNLKATQDFLQAGIVLSKRNSKEFKALSTAQAIIGTYTGAAKALSEVPFPGNIAAAALVIANGLQQVSRINSAGNFQNGGVIGGTSFTGDRLTANVNSGEMILNKQQQAQLFAQANGQGASNESIAKAISSLGNKIENMTIILQADDTEIARSTSRGVQDGIIIGSSR